MAFGVCSLPVSGDHDFGPHGSDAGVLYQHEMGTGGVTDEATPPAHQWHPGRLVYYNRAELKQSDHRYVCQYADPQHVEI